VGDRLVTVITGASRGLGASVARLAATQGHDLVLVARDGELLGRVADECRALGATTEVAVADLLDVQTPARVLDQTLTRFGRIDGLVNNAGIYRTGSARRPDLDQWDEVLAVNLTAPYRMATTFGAAMTQAGSGSIVNVSSIFAVVGVPATAAYAASKGGLISLSRTLAIEWARYNVRVNALAVGHMLTDITASELESELGKQFVEKNIPLARVADPDEVAPLVCLLLGADGAFITGSVQVIDGGFSAR
jgi:NAD(P)-dependent dehydrogenase (short-subunit alcohol dehydrogenase family)